MTLAAMENQTPGGLLREWRQRRRFSQLALATEAEVSTRHLSFVESGRAAASRDMLLHLSEKLAMPLRARNRLLVAGGYAPVYSEQPLDSPDMAAARVAVESILKAHEPFPAMAVDRRWCIVASNAAFAPILEGVAGHLLQPPVNVLRMTLHPEGLAPRIENFDECRSHLLERLNAQVVETGDPYLAELLAELRGYAVRSGSQATRPARRIAVPLRLRMHGCDTVLSFLSTITVFGTPVDVTLSELALECLYPADDATREALLRRA